jgi:hypothetical protein
MFSERRSPSFRAQLEENWRQIALATAALVGSWIVLPLVPISPNGMFPYVASTVIFFAIVVWFQMELRALTRAPLELVLGLAAGFGVLTVVVNNVSPTVAGPLKIAAATALGVAIAYYIERLWWSLLLAFIVAATDIWSVFSSHGVTHKLTESKSQVVGILSVSQPSVGTWHPLSFIGMTDIVFMSMFTMIAFLWGLDMRRNAIALAVSVYLTTAVLVLGVPFVPALPMMSLCFVVAHWSYISRAVLDALQSPGDKDQDAAAT